MIKIKIMPRNCTGCRACEVFCSFHHRKIFNRKISSIEIVRFERKGVFKHVIHDKKLGARIACDMCNGEKIPLCIKFCPTKTLTLVD